MYIIHSPRHTTSERCLKFEIFFGNHVSGIAGFGDYVSVSYLAFSAGDWMKRSVEPEINRRRYALEATNTATINHLTAVIPGIDVSVPLSPL